jgi:hypothetical protein
VDREALRETLKRRREGDGTVPAHVRARNARQRLLAAATDLEFGPRVKRNVWPAALVALGAGLFAGYSPRTTRILVRGAVAMAQEWLKLGPRP